MTTRLLELQEQVEKDRLEVEAAKKEAEMAKSKIEALARANRKRFSSNVAR